MNIKPIITRLKPAAAFIRKHTLLIFVLIFTGIYGFLAIRVNYLMQNEPSSAQIQEKLDTVKRVKIDQEAVDTIMRLRDQNVEVKILFDDARNNPFNE